MMLRMYAVKDELNGYVPPFPLPNDDVARRYLTDQANENPTVKYSPKDFSIWHLGEFNTELGRMIPDEPKCVFKLGGNENGGEQTEV